jgi:hypothetical protein
MSTQQTHWVMDYETILNCFVGVFVHYKNDDVKHVFIINNDRNDIKKLVNFLQTCVTSKEWHISYNGLAFDAQITQYILNNSDRLITLSTSNLASDLYKYAQSVISKSDKGEFQDFAPYKLSIKQIDLFKMNHWDNKAKMSSLKWIQYSMDWTNVEEMPHPHYEPVIDSETLKKIVSYCLNDVLSTKEIMMFSKEQIVLRQTLTGEYGIDLYSASEPRISKELFLYFLHKKLGWNKSEIKTLRTPRDYIVLADCILPYINFKTSVFQNVLNYFRTKVITSTKEGFKHTIEYKGVKTDYGLGGIHGATSPGIYKVKPGWTIMTSDVVSFYPNLAIKNGFHPAHLPKKEFSELYEWIFEERKKIPKTDPKNYVYKIILNSTYGLTGDENSFLYDPKMTMQITVNGQLSLSMLYEMICEEIPDAIPLMQNTDGLETMIPTHSVSLYMDICSKWEQITKLALEHDEYTKMIIRDVNNYIAINKEGKVKSKGAFEWEDLDKKKVAVFHKNKSFLIIPKAIYAYFVNGIKPEDFLAANKNVLDYCAGVKAKGNWKINEVSIVQAIPEKYKHYNQLQKREYVLANGWSTQWSEDNYVKDEWRDNPKVNIDWAGCNLDTAFNLTIKKEGVYQSKSLQKIVRYFISNSGVKLVKAHPDGRQIQVEAGEWMQTVVNNVDKQKPFEEYDINMKYYLNEIYKQIEQMEIIKYKSSVQLSLFK